MTSTLRLASTLVIVATMLVPRAARAQPADAEGLYIEGERHFALREYDEAIERFRAAYRLDPQPLFLFNIAQAYWEKGTCEQAQRFYQEYLRASTDDEAVRAVAQKRVTEIDAGTAESCREPVATPAIAPPTVSPTEPSNGLDASTPLAPAPIDGPRTRPGRGKRIAGLVTVGAGVVLAGTGGYFSSRARATARDLEDRCTPGCDADDAAIAGLDADGKAAQRNATLLYGAGGIAVAAGVALYAWGVVDGRAHARHVALVPARSGAIAVAGWSF